MSPLTIKDVIWKTSETINASMNKILLQFVTSKMPKQKKWIGRKLKQKE